ncbi:MAG: glycosyltransferase family 4 protein [Crocinitomicaceae bacterium]
MRLLILTQYYPPEIGAPQNRLHELAIRLQKSGIHVEILTAMPNYPKNEIQAGYENGKITKEEIDGIPVHRSKIYVSKSKSIISRLLNYFSFVWTSYWRGRKLGKFDFLMVESPPLFLGYTALGLSRKLKAKLIFNVSDLWPESAEKLGLVNNRQLLGLAYRLEARCYNRATLITGQTNGIVENIRMRFPKTNVYWLPNGVDLTYYNPEIVKANGFRVRNGFSNDQTLFFYGGIIGYAQGLQIILEAADKIKDNTQVQFIIQGAGPEKEMLVNMQEKLGLSNIHFLAPVDKKEMPSVLSEIDVALIPLRKLEIFEGAIPSKIFETLAMEVPILLGVDGEARQHFITNANAGYFFEPENADDLVAQLKQMIANPDECNAMGKRGREYANIHFNRNNIADNLIQELHKL